MVFVSAVHALAREGTMLRETSARTYTMKIK